MRLPRFSFYSRRAAWVVLAVMLLALLYNLGGWGVLETSEARYAEISREMLASGDWLHPRLLGILHYHKPPVTYMISSVGMAVFGINSFGVRFFLQISLLIQGVLVYRLGKELFQSKEIAITALLIYFSMPAVLTSARNLTTDSYLATFELLAIWAWLKYKTEIKPGWLYLFYVAMALAFLTKGPVGLVFPLLVVIGYGNYRNSAHRQPALTHQLAGFLIFVILSISWYLYLMLQDKQLVDYFILQHVVERYTNPEAFSRAKPWWFYIVLAPALSLPWSAILFFNINQPRKLQKDFKRLFILWLVVPLLFFSFSSSKLLLYILPLFAGLALLIAWLLYQLPDTSKSRAVTGGLAYYALIAGTFMLIPWLPIDFRMPGWLFIVPVLMLLCLFLIWKSSYAAVPKLLWGATTFTILLLPFSTYLLGANASGTNSSSQLAQVLQTEELQGRQVVVYDKLLPSLAFELKHNLVTIQDRSLHRETQFETDTAWKQHYLQLDQQQDSIKVAKLLEQDVALLVKGDLRADRQWVLRYLHKKRRVGKWNIYF
ncbi:MAG TPA: glycosyltransferase family 39 protein [Pontibacter sp.]